MPRPGFVARRRSLDTATALLARRGIPPRTATGRPHARQSIRPSPSIRCRIPRRDPPRAPEPLGDSKPLPELLFPGMRLTIAFDDISLPLPPMQRPDVRQRVIEAVLDMAAEAGVDDVHFIRRTGLAHVA